MFAGRLVIAIASSLIVFAGVAKGYTFVSNPLARDAIFDSREMLFWFGTIEISVGLLCLACNGRRFAWFLQVACYAAFILLVFNSKYVFAAPTSCGCMGG
jgi:hypothetical protein